MISDLIEFGKWLVKYNQDDFGKTIKDSDRILKVKFTNNKFELDEDLVLYENYEPNFHNSIFNKGLLFPPKPNQNFMIPSTSDLAGFSPFCVKIAETKGQLNTFKNKPKRSLDAFYDSKNSKFKEKSKYYSILEEIQIDLENNLFTFFNNFNSNFSERKYLKKDEEELFKNFFNNYDTLDILNIFKKYFEFVDENKERIIEIVKDCFNSKEYGKNKGYFFLVCEFNNEYDIINDFLFYYCMLIKERNSDYETEVNGKCAQCGNLGISYPSIPCFGINKNHKKYYSFFNFEENEKNFKLRLCKNCNFFLIVAIEKLKSIFKSNILIIPKENNKSNFEDFLKISKEETNDFSKLNEFLKSCAEFNFDLLICKQDKSLLRVFKYIDNYQAFLLNFEYIYLYNEGNLNYLFDEKLSNDKLEGSKIDNLFKLEKIFKDLFINFEDKKITYLNKNFYNFYQIYTMDLVGKKGIFKDNLNSNSIAIFAKYMHTIFSLIYELNLDAISKDMINEIILNSLIILERNNKRDEKGNFLVRFDILKRLNYLFMFKREFLGDNMLNEENVEKLKQLLENIDDNSTPKEFLKILKEDSALKYFFIGQFIRKIDDYKFNNNKNAATFSNFINNANRNNLKFFFVNQILIENEFYVARLNKKAKLIFEIFKNYDNIFNEKGFKYEDYVLLMFTGYYTVNLLKKDGD